MNWTELLEYFQQPWMQRALLVALMVGPVAGLLGVFITLRGMSFFSDAISHGAMAGVALGLLLRLAPDINSWQMLVVLVVWCALTAVVMVRLLETTSLRADTILAFSFTGSVALAVVIIRKLRGYQMLEKALFGEILGTSTTDVWLIGGLCLAILAFLLLNMRALALSTVQESLARLEGINVRALNFGFSVLLAITVALLLKQLGGMLISGLIVIPAAASRAVARSFFGMLVLGALFGLAGALVGIVMSCQFDIPTAPTMVLADLAILQICLIVAAWIGHGLKRKTPPGAGGRQMDRIEARP